VTTEDRVAAAAARERVHITRLLHDLEDLMVEAAAAARERVHVT
jgi:hypothetical protein